MPVRYKENSLSVTVYALYLSIFPSIFVMYLSDCYIDVFSMNALYTNSLAILYTEYTSTAITFT